MSSTEQSIEINVPVRTAYNQWTQFEEFPQFMEGVREVRQLDDKRTHWRAMIGGKEKEWDADIVEQEPDRRVAWRSTSGTPNGGTVTFEPLDAGRTRVTLRLEYEPEGALESIGDALGLVGGRVHGDLTRFKQFIEARGTETGAWRGEIQGGQTPREGDATRAVGGQRVGAGSQTGMAASDRSEMGRGEGGTRGGSAFDAGNPAGARPMGGATDRGGVMDVGGTGGTGGTTGAMDVSAPGGGAIGGSSRGMTPEIHGSGPGAGGMSISPTGPKPDIGSTGRRDVSGGVDFGASGSTDSGAMRSEGTRGRNALGDTSDTGSLGDAGTTALDPRDTSDKRTQCDNNSKTDG